MPRLPECLLWGYDVGPTGPAIELSPGAEPPPIPEEGYRWLHLDAESEAAQAWLLDPKNSVTPVSASSLLAEETRPRVASTEDELLVVLRGVNLNPGADPEDMVSIRVLLESRRVITTRRRSVLATHDLRRQVQSNSPPRSTAAILAQLIERLLDRMQDPLDHLDEEFDAFELASFDSTTASLRRALGEARRTAVKLRRYLSPQRDVILRLAQDPQIPIDSRARLRIRESADRISRFVEDLEANRDRAAVTQEELAAKLAESMNLTSYRLTLIAAIFLPLGFITGLLGINVGGMPLAENASGFWWVAGGLAVITFAQIAYFKGRKWW